MSTAALYVVVSDNELYPESRIKTLQAFAEERRLVIEHVLIDRDGDTQRPQYKTLQALITSKTIQCVVIRKFGQVFSTVAEALQMVADIAKADIRLISSWDQLDTAACRICDLALALLELEQDIRSNKIKAGIADAKNKGKRIGRKPLPAKRVRRVIEAYEDACLLADKRERSCRAIATKLQAKHKIQIHHAVVARILDEYRTGKIDRDGHRYQKSLFGTLPFDADAKQTPL